MNQILVAVVCLVSSLWSKPLQSPADALQFLLLHLNPSFPLRRPRFASIRRQPSVGVETQLDGAEGQPVQKTRTLKELTLGEEVDATVVEIESYGVFCDIGASRNALLQIKDASWGYVEKLEDMYEKGQQFKARIKEINLEKRWIRLALLKGSRRDISELVSGEELEGTVKSVRGSYCLVDIGATIDGVLFINELADYVEGWQRGQKIKVRVQTPDVTKGRVSLTRSALESPKKDRAPLDHQFQAGEIVEGKVLKVGRIGVIVDIGAQIDGLLHISQLSREYVTEDQLGEMFQVGDPIKCTIKEIDLGRSKLDLTQVSPLEKFEAGTEVDARVKSIASFGVFCDIGAPLDALLGIQDCGDGFVESLEGLYEIGQQFKARVKTIDTERGRVRIVPSDTTTGRKSLSALQAGENVEGTVLSVENYGVFVDIGAEVDALLHVTKVSLDYGGDLREAFHVGDTIKCAIKFVSIGRSRIELTQRSDDEISSLEVGAEVDAVVTSITEYGVFCVIGSSRNALLHIQEAGIESAEKLDEVYKVGQSFKARIKEVDSEREKVRLTVKSDDFTNRRSISDLKVGEEVEGTILKVEEYGVFVDIGAQSDALLHIGQVPREYRATSRRSSSFPVGDSIKCTIKETDPDRSRIQLTQLDLKVDTEGV